MTRSESNQQWWVSLGTGHKKGHRFKKGEVQKKAKRISYEDVREMSAEELRRACR